MRASARLPKSLVVLAVCAALVLATSVSAYASDASNDWYRASGPIAPGGVNSGAIDTSGDIDWYYFYNDVPSTVSVGAVQVGINMATGSRDGCTLEIYRWDGGKLVYVDKVFTGDKTPLDKGLTSGLYYVMVRDAYNDGGTGSYDFTVQGDYIKTAPSAGSKITPAPAPIPMTEDNRNEWWQAAGPIVPVQPHTSAIDTGGDIDWYYFYNDLPTGVSAGSIKIGINEATSSKDGSTLELYRWEGGKLVYLDKRFTGDSTPIDKGMPSGLYYVMVRDAYTDGGTGSYDFTVSGDYIKTAPAAGSKIQIVPTAIRMTEENRNEWWQAVGPIVPFRPHVGAIDTGGDIDWYYFYNNVPTGASAGSVKVGINRETMSKDDTTLELYRWEAGKLVYLDKRYTGDASPIDSAMPAGLYFLKLRDAYDDGGTGSYDFTVAGDYVTASRPYLSKVVGNSSTLKRARSYTFSGQAQPAGTVSLAIQKYSTSKRKYLGYRTIAATLGADGAPRPFSASWRPSASGKYRLRWVTSGPADMGGGTSSYRYVTVK